MIIGKKVSRPELAVEAITVESSLSLSASSAVIPLNFEVSFVTAIDDLSCRILFAIQ